jgi:hypothetical protein
VHDRLRGAFRYVRFACSNRLSTVRRWLSSRHQREFEWQRFPQYWRVKSRWAALIFKLIRQEFVIRFRLRQVHDSISVLIQLMGTITLMFFIALMVVLVLETFDDWVITRLSSIEIANTFRQFLHRTWPTLTSLALEPNGVGSLMGTFVQVAAVFLGLYFAAVSMVVNAYADKGAPESVRRTLIKELGDNGYINLVAFFGAVATLLLAETAVGLQPGPFSFVLATVLGIVSILGFVVLGLRTFAFLSPANLAAALPRELLQSMSAAAPAGHRWTDPAIQDYYRRLANGVIRNFREVADFSVSGIRSSPGALANLARSAISLLRIYAHIKNRIPSTSLWFEKVQRYPSWLTVPEINVEFLLRGDSQATPEQIADFLWVERGIEPIVQSVLEILASEGHVDAAADVYLTGYDALQVMGNSFTVDEGLRLATVLSRSANAAISSSLVKIEDLDKDQGRARIVIGFHDLARASLVPIILGLTRAVEVVTSERFKGDMDKIDWDHPRTVYSLAAPRTVMEQTELLAERIEFERAIEGSTVTPQWYQQQFVGRSFVGFLEKATSTHVDQLEEFFAVPAEAEVAQGQYVLAVQSVQRGIEACRRMSILIEASRACGDSLGTLKRIPEEPWPSVDWDRDLDRVQSIKRRLVMVVALSIPHLVTTHWSPTSLPDYFGYAYRILSSECAAALFDDEDLFSKLFPVFFDSCIAARNRLVREAYETVEPARTFFVTEPLADLLHLSGIGKIVSELRGPQYWKPIEDAWDDYLTGVGDPSSEIFLLSTAMLVRQRTFMMPPYEGIRTTWKRRLENELYQEGLLSPSFSFGGFGPSARVSHPSPLLRSIVSNFPGLTVEPIDVFIVTYLARRPEAEHLVLESNQRTFLKDRLKEEELTPDEDQH